MPKEIAFSINPQVTMESGCLALDLREAIREGHSLAILPSKEKHPVTYWQALAQSPADKEALDFFLKLSGKSIPRIDIPSSQVQVALKLLAATQKLFCEGKQLVIDLYGKAEFYYEGTPHDNGKLEIQGKVRWRETSIDLRNCQALIPGKPNAFVYGLTLKMIGTTISWKRLKELYQGAFLLEGGAKQTFLEELDPDDPDEPKLILKKGSYEDVSQDTAPFPILRLTDRWGACADLWMDYGKGQRVAIHDSRLIIHDEKGKLLFKRQEKSETNWEKDLLETDFIKKNVGSAHYYCPLDRVPKSLTFLLEVGWKIEDWQGRQVLKNSGLSLNLEERKQAVAIRGHLQYESHQADVNQVLGAFNRRDNFVQLSSNNVGLLPFDETQQALRDLSAESEIIGEERVLKKSRLGTLDTLWQYTSSSEALQELKDKLQDFQGIEEALPTSRFAGHLRPYQQEGVNWLSFLEKYGFHGILADEMGLGKTVQILAFLSRYQPGGIHLIVMPTSLLFNWRNEIQQFLPSATCTIHQGPQRAKTSDVLRHIEIILTSYTTLRLDLPLLQTLTYDTLILDEAQMIKNADTQTAQAVCKLNAKLRLSLTGTPVENRLQELWSHFHFLMPDLFGSREDFDAEIQAGEADRRYVDRMRRKIAPFLLKRRKIDVLKDLPARIDQVVWIEMADEQRQLYEQLLAGFKTGLLKKVEMEGVGKCRLEILEALLRLRQICCHPLLVFSLTSEPLSSSAKLDTLLEDLETICEEGHKVLIYSQFTSMLKLMTQEARKRNWSYAYLDGSTVNREEVVTRFQEDPNQCLFFISLKAGGVGLNLTAADYVYLYDPWWNEAVEEQAINRAHRIGRKDIVISKRLVVAESIEEKMMKLKAAKRQMIDELMEGEALPTHFTLEDLQFLLTS